MIVFNPVIFNLIDFPEIFTNDTSIVTSISLWQVFHLAESSFMWLDKQLLSMTIV